MKKSFALCLALLLFVSSACPALARGSLSWNFEGYSLGEYPWKISSSARAAAEIKQGLRGRKALCVSAGDSGTHSITVPVVLDASASGADAFYVLLDFSGWTYANPAKGNALLSFSLVKRDGTRLAFSGAQDFSYWYAKNGSFVADEGTGSVFLTKGASLNEESVCLIGLPFSSFGVEKEEAFGMLEISVFSPGVQAGSEFWIGEISINREGAEVWPLRPAPETPLSSQEPSDIAEPSRGVPQKTERAASSQTPTKGKKGSQTTSARRQTAAPSSNSSAAPETVPQGVAGATAEGNAGYTAPTAASVVWNDSSHPWLPAVLIFAVLCILAIAAAFQYNRVYRKRQEEKRTEEQGAEEKQGEEKTTETEKQDEEQENEDV